MVMESPLSPQCVGMEFVRQYYTLLNEAPAHLHRFYNNSSSFIHGGLDPPNRETTLVVGQKQIHQKIQQLNFRDCHAKITQVDSQATLGNGVVVQVTGELSNGGQPMRRFTQTFVLAFQAPKKYYVHNDIFRYQDMLTEEEYEEITRNEIDEEQHQPNNQQANNIHVPATNSNNNSNQVEEERDEWSSQPMVNGTSDSHHHEPTPPEPIQLQASQTATQPIPQPLAQPIHATTTQPIHTVTTPPLPAQPPVTLAPQHDVVVQHQPPAVQQESPPPPTHIHHSMIEPEEDLYCQNESTEPINTSTLNNSGESGVGQVVKTYANLVKGGSSGNAVAPSPTYYSPPQMPMIHAPPPPSPTGGMGRMDRVKPPRDSRIFLRSDENVNSFNSSDPVSNFDSDRGRKHHYNDNQQLFMGNLPLYASEVELKELFGRFGNIIELRVLSKSSKGSGGKPTPNYGFVVFEQASSVQAVLNSRPIVYPDDIGTKLNVEEKKTRGTGGGLPGGRGGSRPGGGPRGGGSIGRDGPPRGPSRPGPPISALPQRQNFHRR